MAAKKPSPAIPEPSDQPTYVPQSATRFRIIKALEMLANKRDGNPGRRHTNIPL